MWGLGRGGGGWGVVLCWDADVEVRRKGVRDDRG